MRKLAEPETESQPMSPAAALGGIAGAAGGWAFSSYTGPSLWIPAIAAGLLALFFAKTPIKPPHFRGAIAVTGGHVVWFIAAAVVTGGWALIGPDIAALSLAIALLWARPSLATALILGLIQLGSLGYNVYLISGAAFGSPDHRALAVHVLFRVLALVALVVGYKGLRGGASASDVAPASHSE